MAVPAVAMTRALAQQLVKTGVNPDLFREDFAEWKTDWSNHEFDSFYFGKDGAYVAPNVGGRRYCLKHVHLQPIADPRDVRDWQRNFARGGRRVSDRCLVYAEKKAEGPYLLIAILDEPNAHDIAAMRTAEHRKLMEEFADIADQFITYDEITA